MPQEDTRIQFTSFFSGGDRRREELLAEPSAACGCGTCSPQNCEGCQCTCPCVVICVCLPGLFSASYIGIFLALSSNESSTTSDASTDAGQADYELKEANGQIQLGTVFGDTFEANNPPGPGPIA